MAATPKRRRLRAALGRRAEAEIGPGATPLDYVVHWGTDGGQVAELAASLQMEMGEGISRGFLSLAIHRLAPDATARIIAARRNARALADGVAFCHECHARRPRECPWHGLHRCCGATEFHAILLAELAAT